MDGLEAMPGSNDFELDQKLMLAEKTIESLRDQLDLAVDTLEEVKGLSAATAAPIIEAALIQIISDKP